MRELVTTIDIDAPPETVWRVLTDFERYDEWNPFLRVLGRPNEGARLDVELRPPDGRPTKFKPTVVTSDHAREFRWQGHLVVPGLFDGEHRFVLEPRDEERGTHVVHAETFGGVLSGALFRFVGDQTEAGFHQMNEALKERAEASLAGTVSHGDEARRPPRDEAA
jgi:hypothetical protein